MITRIKALVAVGALVTLSGCAVHTHSGHVHYVEPRPVYVAPVTRTYHYRPYYYHHHYAPRYRHYHYYR